MPTERAWCADCRRRQVVEDVSTEAQLTRAGEVEYVVTWLECGHNVQGQGRITAAAPGAPVGLPRSHAVDPWADVLDSA